MTIIDEIGRFLLHKLIPKTKLWPFIILNLMFNFGFDSFCDFI